MVFLRFLHSCQRRFRTQHSKRSSLDVPYQKNSLRSFSHGASPLLYLDITESGYAKSEIADLGELREPYSPCYMARRAKILKEFLSASEPFLLLIANVYSVSKIFKNSKNAFRGNAYFLYPLSDCWALKTQGEKFTPCS